MLGCPVSSDLAPRFIALKRKLKPALMASATAALTIWGAPALAQDADAPEQEPPLAEQGDALIIVEANRLRGQLDVEEAPVAELAPEDIEALGASSIQDVLAAIEPATSSSSGRGGGPPVYLINGIRVTNFREFFNYPPESIARLEVFPEATAQRFGFAPDRRVVNIILKNDYSSITTEVEFEAPSRGGYWYNEQELTYLKIADGGRLNFNFEINDTSPLTEADRGLAFGGSPLQSEFRTLVADTFNVEGSANYAKAFVDTGASISLTAGAEYTQSLSFSGLRDLTTLDPLENYFENDQLSFGANYSQQIGDFRATTTFNASRNQTRREIERITDGQFDRSKSTVWSGSNLTTLRGTLLELPAGEVTTTFDLGYDWTQIDSEDTRTQLRTDLTRGDVSAGANIAIPLTSRRNVFLDAIGTLTLQAQVGINHLSDFGTLNDWTLGLNWQPIDDLDFQVTRTWREVAPGLNALGAPRVETFNVPVFDFASGQDTLVSIISGGNPDLQRQKQADWQFGANWKLPFWSDGRLQLGYSVNDSNDVALSSPSYTAAFESAFPDRVTRNGAGVLQSLDLRPIALFETRSRFLSFGINAGGTIGKASQGGRGGPPGARGPSGRPSSPAGGPPSGGAAGQPADGPVSGRPAGGPPDFAAMRERFCNTPEGQMPDLSGLPEQMRARFLDENGEIDPERVKQARERFCGEAAQAQAERFGAIRTAVCADPPDLDALPDEMRARLLKEDGTIDPDRLAEMRQRMCNADGNAQAGSGSPPSQGGGAGRGGPPGLPFGGGRGGPPRYFISLNHFIALENEVTLAPGGPVFDQIAGDVLTGGAVSRHNSRLEGGIFFNGYGMRLSGQYTGKAQLLGSGAAGSTDLFFGDLVRFDVRLFANLEQVLGAEKGFLKGTRLAFRVDNIFDARRRVVDANGDVPFAFEPFRIDPVGRYLGVDLRKQF